MLVGFAFLEIVEAGQGQNRDSLLFLFRAFEWLQNMSDVSNVCDVRDASNARLVSDASNVSDAINVKLIFSGCQPYFSYGDLFSSGLVR